MKKIALIASVIILIQSCKTGGSGQFGKSPVDLGSFNFNMDVPSFFGDETVFRDRGGLRVRVDEDEMTIGDTDSTLHYVVYRTSQNNKDLPLAKMGTLRFTDIDLFTEIDDKEAYMIAATKEDASLQFVDSLVEVMTKEFGEQTPHHEIKKTHDNVTYEWYLKDRVVKLVTDVEDEFEDERPKDENGWERLDDKFLPRPKNWQRGLMNFNKPMKVVVFVTSPLFDRYLSKSYSFSGVLTRYY